MTNGFDIDSDAFDDFEDDFEQTFGFKLEKRSKYMTFGELLDQLREKFAGRGGGKCATAMVYFRLRKLLRADGITGIKPSLDLASQVKRAHDWLDALEKRSGLRMPEGEFTATGYAGCGVMVVAVVLVFAFLHRSITDFAIVGAILAIGFVLTKLDRERLPKACATVGALAGRVAAMNFGLLVSQGAHAGEREIRSALVELLLVYSELPRDQITPQTLLEEMDSE